MLKPLMTVGRVFGEHRRELPHHVGREGRNPLTGDKIDPVVRYLPLLPARLEERRGSSFCYDDAEGSLLGIALQTAVRAPG
jgi:hypothetical protein